MQVLGFRCFPSPEEILGFVATVVVEGECGSAHKASRVPLLVPRRLL